MVIGTATKAGLIILLIVGIIAAIPLVKQFLRDSTDFFSGSSENDVDDADEWNR